MKTILALVSMVLISGCLKVMPLIAPSAKNVEPNISAEFPFESKFISINNSRMHYIDEGNGPIVVLLHGNPTSNYLWRNVVPELSQHFRVIAPDLIGMGKSDKPDIGYSFDDHTQYVRGFINTLGLTNIALVLHDWGGGIGIDYAAKHSDNVRAIAVMEAVVKPMSWSSADLPTKYMFKQFRHPEKGHKINAEGNYFVETLLPMMAGRKLSDEEMSVYKAPFETVESRKPVAQWPKEIPFIEDGPEENVERIGENYQWLMASDIPMLALHAEPGLIFSEAFMKELTADIPRAETINIGSGLHYLQEVQPKLIGDAVAMWLQGI